MYPVNEGNKECRKCKHFDMGSGCVPTYEDILPPCGRDVALGQCLYEKLMKKGEKYGFWKNIRSIKSGKKSST